MVYRNLLWTLTGVLVLGTLYIGANIVALDLGAVMHDLHCPEHGSRVTAAPTQA